jgi:3-oxoacyl-[acyl-carrier-protein] synthase II
LASTSVLSPQSSELICRITGLGLCTPLGETVARTWDALLARQFITNHSRAVGEYEARRVCALARRAAREAIAEAGWSAGESRDAALVVGTSKGPIEAWIPSRVGTANQLLQMVGDAHPTCLLGLSEIAASLNFIGGPRLTISTACASGLHALIRGAMLLSEGHSRVLVVGAESSLHPLFLSSFKRLGVIAPPEIGCRPFDLDRAGFLVSEAAAAVCLEKKAGGMQVERFVMGGDATHLTGGDPQGRTLRRLLASVIDNRPVDLVHAHATGTRANDAVELPAIEYSISVLSPQSSALIYSHKGALGHSLGAAGLISVVLNCMAHQHGIIPPNVRTTRPMPMERVKLSREITKLQVRRSIAVASGFGGAGAAVALASAYDRP